MPKRIAIFWPGDYRFKPNEWALAQSREATGQLVAALEETGTFAIPRRGISDSPRSGDCQTKSDRRPNYRCFCPLDLRTPHRRRRRRQEQPALARLEFFRNLARAGGAAQHGRLARKRRPAGVANLDRRGRLVCRQRIHGTLGRVVHDRTDRLPDERTARGRRDQP